MRTYGPGLGGPYRDQPFLTRRGRRLKIADTAGCGRILPTGITPSRITPDVRLCAGTITERQLSRAAQNGYVRARR
jgi:hypothetical protein